MRGNYHPQDTLQGTRSVPASSPPYAGAGPGSRPPIHVPLPVSAYVPGMDKRPSQTSRTSAPFHHPGTDIVLMSMGPTPVGDELQYPPPLSRVHSVGTTASSGSLQMAPSMTMEATAFVHPTTSRDAGMAQMVHLEVIPPPLTQGFDPIASVNPHGHSSMSDLQPQLIPVDITTGTYLLPQGQSIVPLGTMFPGHHCSPDVSSLGGMASLPLSSPYMQQTQPQSAAAMPVSNTPQFLSNDQPMSWIAAADGTVISPMGVGPQPTGTPFYVLHSGFSPSSPPHTRDNTNSVMPQVMPSTTSMGRVGEGAPMARPVEWASQGTVGMQVPQMSQQSRWPAPMQQPPLGSRQPSQLLHQTLPYSRIFYSKHEGGFKGVRGYLAPGIGDRAVPGTTTITTLPRLAVPQPPWGRLPEGSIPNKGELSSSQSSPRDVDSD